MKLRELLLLLLLLVLPPVVVSELVEVLELLVLCVDDDVERLVLVEVV